MSASRLYYEFRVLWESFDVGGSAADLDASGATVLVSAPAAEVYLSVLEPGTPVVLISAPTATLEAGGVTRDAGTPIIIVAAPTAEHVFVVSAGGVTVLISAPEVTVEQTVGTPHVLVSAPAAVLEVGSLTRDANAAVVLVSAPAATVLNGFVRDAGGAEVLVAAPDVTVERSAGEAKILVAAPEATVETALTLDASGAVVVVAAPAATSSLGANRAAGGASVLISAPEATVEVARRIALGLETSGPIWSITSPPILPPPLPFDVLRQYGRIPQYALYLYLHTRTVVITADQIAEIEPEILDVKKEAVSISDMVEGSDGNGVDFHLLPLRRSSFTVKVANTTGNMSALVESDPMIGADAELFLFYPGNLSEDKYSRRKGEVLGLELTDDYLIIEAGKE